MKRDFRVAMNRVSQWIFIAVEVDADDR